MFAILWKIYGHDELSNDIWTGELTAKGRFMYTKQLSPSHPHPHPRVPSLELSLQSFPLPQTLIATTLWPILIQLYRGMFICFQYCGYWMAIGMKWTGYYVEDWLGKGWIEFFSSPSRKKNKTKLRKIACIMKIGEGGRWWRGGLFVGYPQPLEHSSKWLVRWKEDIEKGNGQYGRI